MFTLSTFHRMSAVCFNNWLPRRVGLWEEWSSVADWSIWYHWTGWKLPAFNWMHFTRACKKNFWTYGYLLPQSQANFEKSLCLWRRCIRKVFTQFWSQWNISHIFSPLFLFGNCSHLSADFGRWHRRRSRQSPTQGWKKPIWCRRRKFSIFHLAAFYSDCQHELEKVTFGWRLATVIGLELLETPEDVNYLPLPNPFPNHLPHQQLRNSTTNFF